MLEYSIEYHPKIFRKVSSGFIITQKPGYILRWSYSADHYGASFHDTRRALNSAIGARKRYANKNKEN